MKLLRDNILVKKVEKNKSDTIIIIEKQESKWETYVGDVLEVGPGRLSPKGNRLEMSVEEGDKILYKQYAGHELEEDIWIINEKDVLAVLG